MTKYFTLLFFFLLSTSIFAQEHGVCGNMPSALADKMLDQTIAKLAKMDLSQTEETKYIPLIFHIISDDNGNGGVNEKQIFQQVCKLNEDYADSDFQFYIKDGNFFYHKRTAIYEEVKSGYAKAFMKVIKKNHKFGINIFIVKTIGSGQGGLGTVLGYYSPPALEDWIVIKKGQVNGASNTLSHEIGHFFSLKHTFYGWEGAPFQEGSQGWPKAPKISPGGWPVELQSGANSSTAADKVTDTPPDYNFGIIWPTGNCDYNGGARDWENVLVEPMENNQMSYFNGCEPYIFTSMQINLMSANYNTSSRIYVKKDFVPNIEQVEDQVTLISPIESTPSGTTNVTLKWNAVSKAQYYFVELARNQNFSAHYSAHHVAGTEFVIPFTLEAGKNYYWRVTPFTEVGNCSVNYTSLKGKFRSDPVAVSNIDEIDAWAVAPNPTQGDINISVASNKALDINAQLISLDGRTLQTLNFRTSNGQQNFQMKPVASKGIYFLRLISENGIETRRVIVQ